MRIVYVDIDQIGMVYYANYLTFWAGIYGIFQRDIDFEYKIAGNHRFVFCYLSSINI